MTLFLLQAGLVNGTSCEPLGSLASQAWSLDPTGASQVLNVRFTDEFDKYALCHLHFCVNAFLTQTATPALPRRRS